MIHDSEISRFRTPRPRQISVRSPVQAIAHDFTTGQTRLAYPDGSTEGGKILANAQQPGVIYPSIRLRDGQAILLGATGNAPALGPADQLIPRKLSDLPGQLKDNQVGYYRGQIWKDPAKKEDKPGTVKTLFATKTATHYRFWIGGDRPQVQLVWEKAIAELPAGSTDLSIFLENTNSSRRQWKAGAIWGNFSAEINPTQFKYWEFSADGAAEFEIAPTLQSGGLNPGFWYDANNWVGFGFSQNAASFWSGGSLFPGRKYDVRQGKISAISIADTDYKLFLENGGISSEISSDLYGLIQPDLLGLERGITLSGDRLYLCIQPEPLDKFADIKLGTPLSFTNAATFFQTYRRVKRTRTPIPDGEMLASQVVSSYHP